MSVEGVSGWGSPEDRDWRVIRHVLPEGWEKAATEYRAIRRRRGPLSDPEVLLRMLLGMAAGNHSLRYTAGYAEATGLVRVSHMALHKRLHRSGDWLEWIAQEMLRETFSALPNGALRLRLLDATSVSRPGSTGTDFRLHVNVALPSRGIVEAGLTDIKGGETFTRFAVQKGDVLVADRAYGTSRGVAYVAAGGGYAVVRINDCSLPMWGAEGHRIDPIKEARKLLPGTISELRVQVRPRGSEPIEGRLCLMALPTEEAEKARLRLLRTIRRKQRKSGRRSLENAKYVFIFTTLPIPSASTQQVFATYRLRWQVELAFKTLKSVCRFGELPHRKFEPGRAWLLAKLVCALVAERLAQPGQVFPPEPSGQQQRADPLPLAVSHDGVHALSTRDRVAASGAFGSTRERDPDPNASSRTDRRKSRHPTPTLRRNAKRETQLPPRPHSIAVPTRESPTLRLVDLNESRSN